MCVSQSCKGRSISTAGPDNGTQGSIQKGIPMQCVLVGATSPWQSKAHERHLPDFLSLLMLYKQDKACLQISACGLFPKMPSLELSFCCDKVLLGPVWTTVWQKGVGSAVVKTVTEQSCCPQNKLKARNIHLEGEKYFIQVLGPPKAREDSCQITKGRYAGGGTLASVAQLTPEDLLKPLSIAVFKKREDIVVNLFVMML